MKRYRLFYGLAITLFAVALLLMSPSAQGAPTTSTMSQAEQDEKPEIPSATGVDVIVTLHNSPTNTTTHELILKYFADGVHESSNGAHQIREIKVFRDGMYADKAHIVWKDSCDSINATISGYRVVGQHINFCDDFANGSGPRINFLQRGNTGAQEGGYTLAHEWGHYYYSLYDEYKANNPDFLCRWPLYYIYCFASPRSDDIAVQNSIMTSQWNAVGGNFNWVNFSTDIDNQRKNAQYRVHNASAWKTLARPVSEDPRYGLRWAEAKRIYHPEIAAVAPAPSATPRIDLPDSARNAPWSNPRIIWVSTDMTYPIVIDRSSSMNSSNKLANAKLAAKLLVDKADINHASIGIIAFDSQVTIVQPLTLIDSQTTKNAIKARIDSITIGGNTAIGEAANTALNHLLAYGRAETNRVVYLLTDGENTSGRDPLSVIPAYQSARIPLYTFGFGSDVNTSVLQRLAQDTGGTYHFAPSNLADLTQAFENAQQQSSPSVGIATGSGTVQSSGASSFPFHVDPTLGKISLSVTYRGASTAVNLTLRAPNGAMYNPSCGNSGTESLCLFQVDMPAQGTWSLQAQASGSPVAVTYKVSGDGRNVITYAASITSLTGNTISYPEPIVLLAVLGKDVPITGAVVSATVQGPTGSTVAFPMRDDGVAPDAIADDGQYSALLNYSQNGAYNITVQFNNSAGTAKLTTYSYVTHPRDGIQGPPQPPVPVGENFQRSARVQVNVTNYRSDDHGNTPSSATSLLANNTDVSGKIDYQNDLDVFRVTVPTTATSGIVFRVSNLSPDMNPSVRILGPDRVAVVAQGNQIVSGAVNGYVYLPVTVAANTTLYAEVSHRSGLAGGTYQISAGPPISGDSPRCTMNFNDVAPADFFYEPVFYLSCNNVISGYSDGTFRPQNNTTRSQLVKIVVGAMGWQIDTTGGPHFSDVPQDHPFYPFIETAVKRGIISGYNDGTFKPFNNVTRGQLSKIVVGAKGWTLVNPATPTFDDVTSSNPFYREIETAVQHNIISGYGLPNGRREFRWGNDATRGQISKIVYLAVTGD